MEDKKDNQVINESELGNRLTLDQYQQSSIIKAIGVGGGGINAVNQMFFHIKDINYVVLDSDSQQLTQSPVPNRILLRSDITYRTSAEESECDIAALFDDDSHLGIIVKEGGDFGLALLCSMACYLVVIDCTLSLRRVSAQQHSVRNRRLFKLMPVSV